MGRNHLKHLANRWSFLSWRGRWNCIKWTIQEAVRSVEGIVRERRFRLGCGCIGFCKGHTEGAP